MKRLFAYKSTKIAAQKITEYNNGLIEVSDRFDRISEAILQFKRKVMVGIVKIAVLPVDLHIRFIQFRLQMTDRYLVAKAEACEVALRVMKAKTEACEVALRVMKAKRKQLAHEQMKTRAELKTFRKTFRYKGNPLS